MKYPVNMRLRRWLSPPSLIFALIVCVWLPALACGFVFDDIYLIEQQTCFRSLAAIPDFFLDPYDACDYRPMRYVTYAIDYAIAGTSPWIYHLTNLLFHAGSAVLLWFILAAVHRRRGREPGVVSALCVLVWACHPALADAVVPVAGLRDVQCTFFYLLCMLLVLERHRGTQWVFLGCAVASFVVALLTKEMAVTAPVVVAVVELGTRREALSPRARCNLGAVFGVLLLLAAMFTLYRAVYFSHSNMAGRYWGGTPWTNLLTTLGLQLEYARLILFPAQLVGDYSLFTVPVERAVTLRVVGGAMVVGGWVALVLGLWRRYRIAAVGLTVFGLAMVPVSHVFPHHELMAEHYLHLPLIGVALALSALPTSPRTTAALTVAVLLLVLRLEVRIPDFRSDGTLGWSIAESAPRNVRNLGRLADFYLDPDRGADAALAERLAWRQLWAAGPGSQAEVGAALRVSSILARGHDDSRAATVLLESVSEHNGRVELRRVLAEFYVDVGDCASARSVLEGLIQEAEHPADIAMLGVCELMEGRFDEARRLATRSLTLKPTADGHFLIGNVEFESGNVGPAMKAWDVTLALDPDHVDALRVSARVLCAVNPAEARRRLACAAALVPADSDALLAVCPPREKPD